MILANGCSFTEGYDLPSLDLAWPHCLGKLTNLPVTNIAIGGGSNDRIFRTLKESLVESSPDLVVVGWTSNDRNELFHQDGIYVRATPTHCLPECEDKAIDVSALHQNWVKFNFNQWINYRNWIYNVLFLQDYLTKSKIPFLFFTAFGDNYIHQFLNKTHSSLLLADQSYQWRDRQKYEPCKDIHNQWKELVKLCNQIDLDQWVFKSQKTMQSYLVEQHYHVDQNGHFLADGHEHWAKVLSKKLS
jgi:hypothetical protein